MNRSRFIIFSLILCACLSAVFVFGKKLGFSAKDDADASPDSGIVAIMEAGQDRHSPPIILRIPQEFRFRSSIGRTKTDGVNLITFYPSFTSMADPANRKFAVDCVGDCNGRMMISIENVPESASKARLKRYFNKGAYGAFTGHNSSAPLVRIEDLPPRFGFDFVFDEVRPANTPPMVTRYLLMSKSGSYETDFVAFCSMTTPYHACELSFSLTCVPTVDVKVAGWLYERFDETAELRRRVDQFVSSMLVEPKCVR